MAQQETQEDVDQIEEVAPKRGVSRGFLLSLLMITGLAVGSYFAFINFIQPQLAVEQQERPLQVPGSKFADKVPQEMGVMYPMDPFLINLARSNGKQFLKVSLTLELSSPEVRPEVKANEFKIVDSILLLLSSKTREDVISLQGKFKLKDEIATRVNRFLVMGHVKDVYFSEFIVQ
ncbi:flagellar basal body-associated FliL family protein [Nitrospina watsonii]|uniref:Flagellar protein FliL n=1 Tax=Nitrospina watsonii TaxID=1323948 RepID=A0ABN8VZR2_9BACT|nr:flagellar basal body-associated FliL family protein [Nitrospina watsonii]CAI2717974.1 Flagellar protein FliL [Nitrospina watsonii]